MVHVQHVLPKHWKAVAHNFPGRLQVPVELFPNIGLPGCKVGKESPCGRFTRAEILKE